MYTYIMCENKYIIYKYTILQTFMKNLSYCNINIFLMLMWGICVVNS